MTTIYLVRHGQKHPHAGDPGLTEVGMNQAKETGLYLKQFPINKVISSPYKRTVETAIQIATVLNLEYSLHDALVERMNWGGDGVDKRMFLKEWVKSTNERDYTPAYGDSSQATGQRIHRLITDVSEDGDHILLVTHGGAILDYLRNLIGDEPLQTLRTTYEEGADFRMLNCAINAVLLSDKPVLKLLNFTEHLTDTSE